MAVWICLNFTKPRAPTNRSVRVSITNIRLAMNFSSSTFRVERDAPESTLRRAQGRPEPRRGATLPADVQQDTAVNPMTVPRLLSEKCRSFIPRLQRDKSVVTPQSPPSGVPAHAAADVAREERLRVVDAKRLLLEKTQPTDAARHVRNDRSLVGRRDNEVAAVVHEVRGLEVRCAVG